MFDLVHIKGDLMKRLNIVALFFILYGIYGAAAQNATLFFDEADALFGKVVSNGKVDYQALKNDPSQLDAILSIAKNITVSKSRPEEYQAFWINAYNLSVLKGVIDNYPLRSPLDKNGFFDRITYDLAGERITLNDIENKKLRAQFDDPRFHFVLVCGAKGCPPIIARSYSPGNLEKLLQQQTIKALNDSSFIRVSEGKLALSEIFKWYKEDFVKGGSTEIEFLNKYRREKVPEQLEISYYSYDWRLNSI